MSRLQSKKLCFTAGSRAGVSMIEVLVSMFILSIGLLSIASLLPVGQSQVIQADIEDRSSVVGQNAFRSFSIRGYANPLFWLHDKDATNDMQPVLLSANAADRVVPATVGSPPNNCYGLVFIDPILGAPSPGVANYKVPHTPAANDFFPRLTIKATPTFASKIPLTLLGAEAVFVGQDDLVNEPRTSPDSAPPASVEMISGSPARRQFEGNFSWMAMLMPKNATATWIPYPGQECELSIIVFHQRSPSVLTDPTTNVSTERELTIAGASSFLSDGINGGEVEFTGGTSNELLIRPGEWLLLYNPNNGRPVAKWYKILNAERFDPESGLTTRQLTLSGPDWDKNTSTSTNVTKAYLFDGAVGVYTKSIRLEGQSSWSNWDGL